MCTYRKKLKHCSNHFMPTAVCQYNVCLYSVWGTSFLYPLSLQFFEMKNFSCNKYVIPYAVLVILTSATSFQLVVGQSEISPVLLVPMAQSGESIYLAWSGNDTGIPEIMFRASNDNGITFGEKINLSNSTTSDSINPQITASGNNVLVAWWENNQTFQEPVIRISTDRGNNFGPILNLSTNDTLETWITYYQSNT